MKKDETFSTVDKTQEAENCRALFLSVIYQAILDSGKSNKNNRRDLPQIINSEWWRQIFSFAGIEKEFNKVNKIIVSNCNNHEKAAMNIRKSCRVYR